MIVALLLLAHIDHSPTVVDRVDRIELNHVYHEHNGTISHSLDQWIFWEWIDDAREFRVVAWRQLHFRTDQRPPIRTADGWLIRWHDHGVLREVHADEYLESWTLFDRELEDRQRWCMESRRLLRGEP